MRALGKAGLVDTAAVAFFIQLSFPMRALPLVLLLFSGCITVEAYPEGALLSNAELAQYGEAEFARASQDQARWYKQRNIQALISEAVRIATDVQAWGLRPARFGGGDGRFDGLSFLALGYEVDHEGRYLCMEGTFELVAVAPGRVVLRGRSHAFENQVRLELAGLGATDAQVVVEPFQY
jgi:hypothetical protein